MVGVPLGGVPREVFDGRAQGRVEHRRLDGGAQVVGGQSGALGQGAGARRLGLVVGLEPDGAQARPRVVVADLNAEGAGDVVQKIKESGGDAVAVVGDLSERALVDQVVGTPWSASAGWTSW